MLLKILTYSLIIRDIPFAIGILLRITLKLRGIGGCTLSATRANWLGNWPRQVWGVEIIIEIRTTT